MRFVRKQIIISTVTDKDFNTNEDIEDILSQISKGSIDVAIEYRDNTGYVKSSNKCRINRASNGTIDIKVYVPAAQFSVKKIPYQDIIKVDVTTKQNNIIVHKKDMSRMDLLDIDAGE